MKYTIQIAMLMLLICSQLQGQNKRELQFKIEELQSELSEARTLLSETRQEIARYKAETEAVVFQMAGLKETNASLLQNLNSFTALSNKKTENIGKSLETLRTKENQLKLISNELTRTDSVTLALLTNFKNSLGTDAKAGLSNGAVTIVLDNIFLFNDVDTNYTVEENAIPVLGKIAAVLKEAPHLVVTVETNSNALDFQKSNLKDNWDLSALQAAAVVRVLSGTYEIAPNRLQAIGKSEYGFDGVETSTRIKVQSAYASFYKKVKELMN